VDWLLSEIKYCARGAFGGALEAHLEVRWRRIWRRVGGAFGGALEAHLEARWRRVWRRVGGAFEIYLMFDWALS
jgi:hypothetical protein